MRTAEDSRRYLENWQDEIDSAAEYRAMASSEPDGSLARVYGNLARMEEGHIAWSVVHSSRSTLQMPASRAPCALASLHS